MRITVNGQQVIIPSSLNEFTLGQRIDFYNEHGKELEDAAKAIIEMEAGLEKELEVSEFHFEKMARTFAFFAGTTVEAVKDSEHLDTIASIYYSSLAVLFEEENELQPASEFQWNDEMWVLHPPSLKHGDSMTFGELIDSKQLVKNMIELGKGKWEYMLPICAIYLRKKDEPYDESFIYEGSDRLGIMRTLPMDIALQVGFFLSSSMNMSINTSLSSNPQELKELASMEKNTLTVGDGLTS